MKQGILMWLAGMIGVLFMLLLLPAMLINKTLSLPLWTILLTQLLQSSAIIAFFIWIGMTFHSKVDLHSPCFEAIVTKHKFVERLCPQLKPGCVAGFIVGIFLIGLNYFIPPELIASAPQVNPIYRILTEVFYGGITEEILMRWGLMTLILWLLWRFIQRDQNTPSRLIVWISILANSLLFALGHIPAAHVLAGHLTAHIVTYIIIGNTLAGIVFSFLYKQYGLEAAMIAHASAHLIKELGLLLGG
ncbi:MAG: CPBP family intramembrane glutamic endopeptidase [Legionella sp.]